MKEKRSISISYIWSKEEMTRTQQSEATNLCGVRFEFDESSVSYCECMWRERERDPGIHIQKREREREIPG